MLLYFKHFLATDVKSSPDGLGFCIKTLNILRLIIKIKLKKKTFIVN